MPRQSILIPLPLPNSGLEKAFEDTLASVLQYRPADSEVLVSHAGDYDDPYGLSGEVRFLEQRSEATLVELVNYGLERARGEVLHLLMPGHAVVEGWTDGAMAAFADPRVGSVVPVVVSDADPGHVLHCGVGYSCGGARWMAGVGQSVQTVASKTPATVGPALAAGFYRTDAVCGLEGFSTELGDSLPDVDLALSLRAVGYRSVVSASSVIRATLPPHHEVASFEHGQQAERLFRRHARQLGWLRSFASHPLTVLVSAFADVPHPGAVVQIAGRVSAWFEHASYRRYLDLLEDARDEASFAQQGTLPISTRGALPNPTSLDAPTKSRRAA